MPYIYCCVLVLYY